MTHERIETKIEKRMLSTNSGHIASFFTPQNVQIALRSRTTPSHETFFTAQTFLPDIEKGEMKLILK